MRELIALILAAIVHALQGSGSRSANQGGPSPGGEVPTGEMWQEGYSYRDRHGRIRYVRGHPRRR